MPLADTPFNPLLLGVKFVATPCHCNTDRPHLQLIGDTLDESLYVYCPNCQTCGGKQRTPEDAIKAWEALQLIS